MNKARLYDFKNQYFANGDGGSLQGEGLMNMFRKGVVLEGCGVGFWSTNNY